MQERFQLTLVAIDLCLCVHHIVLCLCHLRLELCYVGLGQITYLVTFLSAFQLLLSRGCQLLVDAFRFYGVEDLDV